MPMLAMIPYHEAPPPPLPDELIKDLAPSRSENHPGQRTEKTGEPHLRCPVSPGKALLMLAMIPHHEAPPPPLPDELIKELVPSRSEKSSGTANGKDRVATPQVPCVPHEPELC